MKQTLFVASGPTVDCPTCIPTCMEQHASCAPRQRTAIGGGAVASTLVVKCILPLFRYQCRSGTTLSSHSQFPSDKQKGTEGVDSCRSSCCYSRWPVHRLARAEAVVHGTCCAVPGHYGITEGTRCGLRTVSLAVLVMLSCYLSTPLAQLD